MQNTQIFLVFLGMGLVTYIPRLVPLVLFSRKNVPQWFSDWLSFIPAAILSALLLPALIIDNAGNPDFFSEKLWAAIPTFWVGMKTRSLGGSVLAGMFFFWAAQHLARLLFQ